MINQADLIVNPWSSKKANWSLKPATGVQVVHLPSSIVVTCDSERSQHANRAKAIKIIENKLTK